MRSGAQNRLGELALTLWAKHRRVSASSPVFACCRGLNPQITPIPRMIGAPLAMWSRFKGCGVASGAERRSHDDRTARR
jgi:hypothetical protein